MENYSKQVQQSNKTLNTSKETTLDPPQNRRRYWLVTSDLNLKPVKDVETSEDDKDEKIKSKISVLIDQTLHDTGNKITDMKDLKNKHRDAGPYKAGFILSMVKKCKDVMNELFNVAVKHKDDWKALEQLKVFELIVHTNVDTTNLVRQLVEIHIQNLNTTNNPNSRKRLVLLKK